MRTWKIALSMVMVMMLMVMSYSPATAQPSTSKELTMAEKKEILTLTALDYGIPPEILKAIAYEETRMMQFNEDGTPIETNDKGIGIMQVTNYDGDVDENRLKTDTAYNIKIGAEILKDKWNWMEANDKRGLPSINESNPKILEHWYFPIMAYNGASKRNDPSEQVGLTYQEGIYDRIEKSSLINISPLPELDFNYNEEGELKFPTMHYQWDQANTYSSQMFSKGDNVVLMNASNFNENFSPAYGNLRTSLEDGAPVVEEVPYYTQLTIVSGPHFTNDQKRDNHFITYEMKGNGINGYIASANLRDDDSFQTVFLKKESLQPSKSVSPQKTWTVSFNTKIERDTVTPRNLYIVSENGVGISSTVSLTDDLKAVTINPTKDLDPGTYHLYIKDIQSAKGVDIKEPIQMTFTVQ